MAKSREVLGVSKPSLDYNWFTLVVDGESLSVGDGKAGVNFGDGDVTLAVAVLVAPDDETGLQPASHRPERVVILQVLITLRVLVGDGDVEAVVLAHG